MSRTPKIIIGIIVVIIIVVLAIKFSSGPKRDEASILKIGVISSLSGDYAAVGENMVKGIKTAEAVYEQGGGKKVDLVVEDDGGDGVKGMAAFQKLSQIDHVEGLINFFTTTMDSIYVPAKSAGYPVMMLAFQANNVADDYVFQMTPGNDAVWPKYVKYIKSQDYDLKNPVFVYSKAAAQESFAKSFSTLFGATNTLYAVTSSKEQLRSDAAKIVALKPTTIVFFMTPDDGALLTKEILPIKATSTRLIYDIQLVTGTGNYKNILGDLSKINGAITLSPEGERDQAFIDAYHKLYPGEEPGFLADFGYDTFMTYMNAYDKDNAKWIANLRTVNTKGASGQIKFDKDGIRLPDLVIKKVTNGELVNISRLEF